VRGVPSPGTQSDPGFTFTLTASRVRALLGARRNRVRALLGARRNRVRALLGARRNNEAWPFATLPLGIVSFHLTPQDTRRKIPASFPLGFRSRGPDRKKSRVVPEGGKACSICRAGLCNALIRNARLAAIGCGRATPEVNSAATVVRRSTMCRRRWAHAFGCVPARWEVTVRWAVNQDVHGNRHRREIGPVCPGLVWQGRAVPARFPCAHFGLSSKKVAASFRTAMHGGLW
jgi:hypothetical protein